MADNEFNDLTSDENLIQQESTEDVTDKKCPNCGATVVLSLIHISEPTRPY